MLKFYVISTALCLLVVIITTLSMYVSLKREGYKSKSKTSWIEILRSALPHFIPIFNILLTLILIFAYESLLEKTKEKCIKNESEVS